jgi:hypothetical protein
MKARQLIDGASFGLDALKAIGRAFDEAWAQIAAFGDDPKDILITHNPQPILGGDTASVQRARQSSRAGVSWQAGRSDD